MCSVNFSPIRPVWLLLMLLSGLITVSLLLLRNHDAILIIGLHLNFKMGFISAIESKCEQRGTPAVIQRNEKAPVFPQHEDNCDRSGLGQQEVSMPDPHASYRELEVNSTSDGLASGGKYSPPECQPSPKFKIAVIIPHRHREYHLKQLLSVLHVTFLNI